MRRCIAVGLVAVLGCGHKHDKEGGHSDHHSADTELPAQSATVWTDRTELFVENKPLIVGTETGFAAHVTIDATGKPVTAGSATLTLTMSGGEPLEGIATAPASPGIFRPTLTPTKPGKCELKMSITSPQLTDAFVIGPCEVFATEAAARAAVKEEPEVPGRITYLKEQAWKTDFTTIAATERDLQDGVRATGEIRPVAGKEAQLTAPAAGRVSLVSPAPILGMPVKKDQVLATITPRVTGGTDRPTISSDVTAAEAEAAAARTELERAQRLVAAQAAAPKAVDEATTRVKIAEARLSGARGRLGQFDAGARGTGGGRVFQVRAPVDGTLVSIEAASGQGVEEGQTLFTVIDLDRVWLVARVFEADVPKVENAQAAWFAIDGYDQPFTVDASNGKLVTVGRVVDPQTRTVPVIFEVDNTAGKLRIGNFTKTVIATGAPRKALAIPDSAIVEDAGRSVAFVMVEGESFERRPLRLGIRANGWSEVLEGVERGERVVTKGAYEVKLASASGSVPAHGHAH
ncbi:MAG: efflux RND transporter periplasmic adaptor subunit [Deltaproteobacteria bacterium]|nr:efflux RND transporter periplasmic adaptor subunit [Deltaproteobacteria bacterium]